MGVSSAAPVARFGGVRVYDPVDVTLAVLVTTAERDGPRHEIDIVLLFRVLGEFSLSSSSFFLHLPRAWYGSFYR